jgi:two-component system nitrogen regulation sensor histidine kinase NtrY
VAYAVATFAFLSLALILTQIFLHQTSVGSRRFAVGTLLLWTATVLVILALLTLGTVLGRNLIKLHFERKSGQVGSRFRVKMVRTFIALSLLPAVLLFFLAYGLINKSIEQWFSAPALQLLDNSRGIAAQYYEQLRIRSLGAARALATAVDGEESLRPEQRGPLELRLSALAAQHGLDGIRIYDARGAVACEIGRVSSGPEHDGRAARAVAETLRERPQFSPERAEGGDALRESVLATAPLVDGRGRVIGAALAETRLPRLQFKADSVLEAYDRYTELQREHRSLRSVYLLMLALSTLLIVFAFSWFAIYLAKRITVPIQALVEGAAAVAGGNLSYRVETEAFDELDDLVVSFNRMTGDLAENKTHIEAAQDRLRRTNVELDDRRRYIETILQTIGTGVVSLDGAYRVGTMNRAAARMFGLEDDAAAGGRERRLDDLMPEASVAAVRALLHKSQVLGSVARNIELRLAGRTLHLATTATPLLDSQGQRTGWVLVLDDVTELLAAEKTAAWQEVARRLAHEIKNPLTPIQLSAERVLRRYKQLAEPARQAALPASWRIDLAGFDGLLEECVRTITQEADTLKNLVDEFSRFARLPVVRLQDADLHGVLENTLNLYNGRIQDVRVLRAFSRDLPPLRLDPEQMRRVFINLFDNALEAMAENRHAKVLEIRTLRNTLQRSVRVEVSDTGRGFPAEYKDSLFLPYFSTRKGGTGLGLAIVRQIITDHNGQVRAEPNRPLGTRIVIDLPLAPF